MPGDVPPLDDGTIHSEMEALHGKPLPLSPQKGIETMQQHIAALQREMADYEEASGKFPEQAENYTQVKAACRRQIAECENRIKEYRLQFEGRN